MRLKTKQIYTIIISLLLALSLLCASPHLAFLEHWHWKTFGGLLHIEHNLRPLPKAIKDILLVAIDNETLKSMPQRWPYPRQDFAKVIDNLADAGAKVIAFDFVFLGKSNPKDDALLKAAIANKNNVVLASTINEEGLIDFSSDPALISSAPVGIVTKLQGEDGIIRRSITYLVDTQDPKQAFLSWGMQILKIAEDIDLKTLASSGSRVTFQNTRGKKWKIPVDPQNKTFLIHFRAHSVDFPSLSFYRVLKGDFDPAFVKNKIVLIGFLSSLLQDLHHNSFGWLPGLTLNANTFLTLYTRSFLREIPKIIEQILLIIGVLIATLFLLFFDLQKAREYIGLEIVIFFVVSYLLLASGFIWNYFLFPLAVVICPYLANKIILALVRRLWLNRGEV